MYGSHVWIFVLLAIAFLATRNERFTVPGWKNTVISAYGFNAQDDNGVGASGVDLAKFGSMGLAYQGRPVYPVAVHHDNAAAMLYKIVEVQVGSVAFLGIVLDFCDRADRSCRNRKKFGMNYLIDVHASAFAAARMTPATLTKGKYRVVGSTRPSMMPRAVWSDDIQKNKDSVLCSCTGKCSNREQKWTLLDACT